MKTTEEINLRLSSLLSLMGDLNKKLGEMWEMSNGTKAYQDIVAQIGLLNAQVNALKWVLGERE